MKLHSKAAASCLVLALATATSVSDAAIINISNTSLEPDGTNAVQADQTQINTLNDGGADLLPNSNGNPPVYLITTFTFGADSNAHFTTRFNATGGQNRLGVRVQDNGLVDFVSSGDPGRTSFNIATDNGDTSSTGYLAGQTVTLLIKQQFDTSFDSLRATLGTGDDTLMSVWINPDLTDVEGSGITAGDMHTLWNSNTYRFFTQTIENQSTPGSAGDSLITNTVILTGSDATFANALALAVPEPSSAILGGLGMLALLRRRRDG